MKNGLPYSLSTICAYLNEINRRTARIFRISMCLSILTCFYVYCAILYGNRAMTECSCVTASSSCQRRKGSGLFFANQARFS